MENLYPKAPEAVSAPAVPDEATVAAAYIAELKAGVLVDEKRTENWKLARARVLGTAGRDNVEVVNRVVDEVNQDIELLRRVRPEQTDTALSYQSRLAAIARRVDAADFVAGRIAEEECATFAEFKTKLAAPELLEAQK